MGGSRSSRTSQTASNSNSSCSIASPSCPWTSSLAWKSNVRMNSRLSRTLRVLARTVRRQAGRTIMQQGRRFLEEAGATVTSEGEDAGVEVSPLISYSGEGLEFLHGRQIKAPAVIEKED